MEHQLVTVIIPTKDRPELLERALRSIVGQTYVNLEILVVDDGSSPPVALSRGLAGDHRIRILRLDPSGGPAEARNLGIEKARGAVIAFLDDDDEFTPERIQNAVTVLETSVEKIAAVESGHSGWFEDRLVYEHLPSQQRSLRTALLREPSVALPTMMVKRSAFDVVGAFDPALDRYEDWDLWLRLTDVYDVTPLNEIHVRRQLHHPVPAKVRLHRYSIMFRRLVPRIRALPLRKQMSLWTWHARFFMYRVVEVLLERVAGQRFLQELKIHRLSRSGKHQ